jgi:L-asparaginase
MMRSSEGAGAELTPDECVRDLRDDLPVLGRIAAIESRVLLNIDSGDMQPGDWLTIAQAVHGAVSTGGYDGIVIVHGTDTMAYTASALGLLLGRLPLPVVLTGSQRPLAEVRSDARQNLIDAALVATMNVPEVVITFSSRAVRGVRAIKRDAWALDAFDSPNCGALVELGVGVGVAQHVRAAGPVEPFDDRLERRVLSVRVFPGLDPSLVVGALHAGVRGLVLSTYGTGNVPHLASSLVPALLEARERDVPVLITSQCTRGAVDLRRYEGGAQAEAAGAISGGDMTAESAIAKLMIGLGRYGPGNALRAYLESDAVGERTPEGQARA